jgi:hypothetical protein
MRRQERQPMGPLMKYASRIVTALGLMVLAAAFFLHTPHWVGIVGFILLGISIVLPNRWSA